MYTMYFVKLCSMFTSVFFLISANIYLFNGTIEQFRTRLGFSIGVALVYKLLNMDQYKYVDTK